MENPLDPGLRPARAEDLLALAETLSAAFENYPLTEWVVRRDAQRDAGRLLYFQMFLQHGLRDGLVLCSPDRRSAAIWFAPNRWRAGLFELLARLPRLAQITGFRALASRIRELRRLAAYHPREPHWYLELIGTHPSARCRGKASTLLNEGLDRARSDGVGAYLITSSEAALPFYSSRGFETRESLEIPGGPTCWGLWHDR